MVLSFMIPMAMAWEQPSTAAITVMLIASAGGIGESLSKALMRVIGTVVGAIIGLALIAVFPQDRVLYLLILSVILMCIIYLYYAYRGDSSVFMLSAMVIMMIFLHGPQNAFLYGVDRVYMTLFGIAVYSFISIFIWPIKEQKEKETDFPEPQTPSKRVLFVFMDRDNFKATLQLLSVFWMSTLFWIYFNPPGGFLLVTLATLLGLFTTFSPFKPSLMMALLTFGFVFASAMYIFVLPNLVYGWELALFIFVYSFIGAYFIPPKMTLFFLIGMFLLGIDNSMSYNFALFINTLLVFYLFLIILMLFHNFPFSTKPEHLFLQNKREYFKHFEALLSQKSLKAGENHLLYLNLAVMKMHLWASKIDADYFVKVSRDELENFVHECEELIKKQSLWEKSEGKKSIISELNRLKNSQVIDFNSLKENRF